MLNIYFHYFLDELEKEGHVNKEGVISSLSKSASSSSRVKSPDAFYQPQSTVPPPPPLGSMSLGNQETVGSQSSQVAMQNKENSQQAAMSDPAPPPSIQINKPVTTPAFRPKYTGML
jgi:hypothetical protein